MRPPAAFFAVVALWLLGVAVRCLAAGAEGGPFAAPAGQTLSPEKTLADFQKGLSGDDRRFSVECDLIEVQRESITVRDASDTITLRCPENLSSSSRVGDRVRIEGEWRRAMERIPDFPTRKFLVSKLEQSEISVRPVTTRVRALLRPPTAGRYRFWIAGADESELSLSTDDSAANLRQIARVNDWIRSTGFEEWNKHEEQSSGEIELQGGSSYRLEVRHRSESKSGHWSVAWQGPGIERSVIGAEYLQLCESDAAAKPEGGSQAAQVEDWESYLVPLLTDLNDQSCLVTRAAKLANLKITSLGRTNFPAPVMLRPGDALPTSAYLPYVEIEGVVASAEAGFSDAHLELAWGHRRVQVTAPNPKHHSVKGLLDRQVKVRGFARGIAEERGKTFVGDVHCAGMEDIILSSGSEGPLRAYSLPGELTEPSAALWTAPSVRSVGTLKRSREGEIVLEGEQYSEIVGFYSKDGIQWQEIGRGRLPITQDMCVGLTATAYDAAKSTTAVFDALNGLSGPLRGMTLGMPSDSGSASVEGGEWTLRSKGRDLWNDTQECYFASTRMSGNFEVSVRCKSLEDTGGWAKGGLMVRQSAAGESPYALVAATPRGDVLFQYRETTRGLSSPVVTKPVSLPCWLKVRVRNLPAAIPIDPVVGPATLEDGAQVEVAGVLEWKNGRTQISGAFLRTLRPAEAFGYPFESARTLRSFREVRETLGSGQSYLAELRGTVTSERTIQCENEAISLTKSIHEIRGGDGARPGDQIEIAGSTNDIGSSIVLSPILARHLGQGQMPTAMRFPLTYLATGAVDGHWVEQEGIVSATTATAFNIQVQGGSIEVTNPGRPLPGEAIRGLLGAVVIVRGVCSMEYDEQRRPTKVRIVPPDLDFVYVGRAGLPNVFDAPAISISEMIQTAVSGPLRYRLVRGVVTHSGEQVAYLQNEAGAIRVELANRSEAVRGDEVEASGIPFLDGQSIPCLAAAQIRKIQKGNLPKPLPMTGDLIERVSRRGELVVFDATILDAHPFDGSIRLTLSVNGRIVNAELFDSRHSENALLPKGTVVRVQGVCSSKDDAPFVLISGAQEVKILAWPAEWKRERALVALACTILLAALLFFAGLMRYRKRLKEQIVSRQKAEAEFNAVEGERNRLAAELHDTLEQSLTGVALQLLAASKSFEPNPQRSRKYLDNARNLLNESQLEVRRSVWNLRSRMLEDTGLAEALTNIGDQLTTAANVKFSLKTVGKVLPLPEFLEDHLLRIGQEAITNAVKHAGASEIDVCLGYGEHSICLTVTDDGLGMEAKERVSRNGEGHFGLMGMKERATKIEGVLTIESRSGRTSIKVEAPAMEATTL